MREWRNEWEEDPRVIATALAVLEEQEAQMNGERADSNEPMSHQEMNRLYGKETR